MQQRLSFSWEKKKHLNVQFSVDLWFFSGRVFCKIDPLESWMKKKAVDLSSWPLWIVIDFTWSSSGSYQLKVNARGFRLQRCTTSFLFADLTCCLRFRLTRTWLWEHKRPPSSGRRLTGRRIRRSCCDGDFIVCAQLGGAATHFGEPLNLGDGTRHDWTRFPIFLYAYIQLSPIQRLENVFFFFFK